MVLLHNWMKIMSHFLFNKIPVYVYIEKDKLVKQCTFYWNQGGDKHIHSGKLDIYFQLKQSFCMEPYLSLTNVHYRQAICKICISAHKLMIEFGRYHKPKPIPREECLC